MQKLIPFRFVILLLSGLFLAACTEKKQEIVVVSKTLKKERETNTAVPDEFSSFAPASSGTSFWVEGTVRNEGVLDAANVEIVFKCSEGAQDRVLAASVKLIPAGKTVPYRTKRFQSKYEMKLVEEEPEIIYAE